MVLSKPKFRVTQAGARHKLHYDASHTILVQLTGSKNVTLVPSEQLDLMYPYPQSDLLYRRARIDLDKPNYDAFPLSRQLRPVSIVSLPGDIILIPHYTGHMTQTLADQSSISFRFR